MCVFPYNQQVAHINFGGNETNAYVTASTFFSINIYMCTEFILEQKRMQIRDLHAFLKCEYFRVKDT